MDKMWWMAAAAGVLLAVSPDGAHAQTAVYKCNAHSYSEQPCSARVVRTYDAPVPVSPKPRDVVVHRLPGETVAEFNTRKSRARLPETDRNECARLDKRIPVERERAKGPAPEDIAGGEAALADSLKRFTQLRC